MKGHDQVRARFTTYTDRLRDHAHEVAKEAAQVGAQTMRETLDVKGTGWEDRGPGQPREKTGSMRASVDVLGRSTKGTTGSGAESKTYTFGYIRGVKPYMGYQDSGFINKYKRYPSADGGPAGYTLGTGALAAGLYAAREYLRAHLRKGVRKL